MVESCMIDYMHVLQGAVKKHFIKLFQGERIRVEWDEKWNDMYNMSKEDWISHQSKWILDPNVLKKADTLYLNLSGPPGLLPQTVPPFNRKCSWSAWNVLCFVRIYGIYILSELIEDHEVMKMYIDFISLLEALSHHSYTNGEVEALKVRTNEVMKNFEKLVPITEQTMITHSIYHIIDQIERWGPVRSYWRFPHERMCGVITKMIKKKEYN